MRFPLPLCMGTITGRPLYRQPTVEETRWLLEQLAHRNHRYRWMAADMIGKLDIREAREPLILLLGDPHWLVRFHAVKALGRLKDETAWPAIKRALRDDIRYVRRIAAHTFLQLAGERGIVYLIDSVRLQPELFGDATFALGRFMSATTALRLCREAIDANAQPVEPHVPEWLSAALTPLLLLALPMLAGSWKLRVIDLLAAYGDRRALEPLTQCLVALREWGAGWRAIQTARERTEYRWFRYQLGKHGWGRSRLAQ